MTVLRGELATKQSLALVRLFKGMKTIIMHRTKDLDRNWCIYYVENRGYDDYNIIEKYYD